MVSGLSKRHAAGMNLELATNKRAAVRVANIVHALLSWSSTQLPGNLATQEKVTTRRAERAPTDNDLRTEVVCGLNHL